jgi:hypothetical protein
MDQNYIRLVFISAIVFIAVQSDIRLCSSADKKLEIGIQKVDFYKKYKLCDKELTAKNGHVLVVLILKNYEIKSDDIAKIKISNYVFKCFSKNKSGETVPSLAVGTEFLLADNKSIVQLWLTADPSNRLINGIVASKLGGTAVIATLPEDIDSFQFCIIDNNYMSEQIVRK